MVCPFQISRLTFRNVHVMSILVPLVSSSTREYSKGPDIRESWSSNFRLFLVTTLQPLVRPSVTGSNETGRDRAAGQLVCSTCYCADQRQLSPVLMSVMDGIL